MQNRVRWCQAHLSIQMSFDIQMTNLNQKFVCSISNISQTHRCINNINYKTHLSLVKSGVFLQMRLSCLNINNLKTTLCNDWYCYITLDTPQKKAPQNINCSKVSFAYENSGKYSVCSQQEFVFWKTFA